MRARGFFEPIEHPLVGTQRVPDVADALLGRTEHASGPAPAPTLGQHTDEVLRDELGVADDELARLRAEHVIGTRRLRLTRPRERFGVGW